MGINTLFEGSLSAQLDMAEALGETPNPKYADILANLAPFNTAAVDPPPSPSPSPSPSPPSPTPPPVNCSQAGAFTAMADTRFNDDYHMGHGESLLCCQAECEADPDCAAFTFCPDNSVVGCQKGPSCWKYKAGAAHIDGKGFSSGTKAKTTKAAATEAATKAATEAAIDKKAVAVAIAGAGAGGVSVWTAFQNATFAESDAFAVYPLWLVY